MTPDTTATHSKVKAAQSAIAAAMAAPEDLAAAREATDEGDFWAEARSRCDPKALSAAWQYGRALAANADSWSIARARLDALYARRDAWEALAEDPDEDHRPLPADLRREIRHAEDLLLSTPAPNWLGIADKVHFLLRYVDDDVWEPDWTPNPDAPGLAGAVARLLISAEQIGTGEPSRDQALLAALAAEHLSHTAAHHPSGYQAYAVNPQDIGPMATIVGAILRDARALGRGKHYASFWAIQEVWFPGSEAGSMEPVQ